MFRVVRKSAYFNGRVEMWSDDGTYHLLDDDRYSDKTLCGCHNLTERRGWFTERSMTESELLELANKRLSYDSVTVCKRCLAIARKRGMLE